MFRETFSDSAGGWADDALSLANRLRQLDTLGDSSPPSRSAELLEISRALRDLSRRSRAVAIEARARAARLRVGAPPRSVR